MTLLVFSALIFSFCNTLSLENYYSNGIGQPPACYLTIIPQAQMGSETIAHEAQSRMGYWLRVLRMRGIIIIVLVKSNYLVKNIENKNFLAS